MADRSVKYILTATTSGFVSGMKSAQGAAKGLNDNLMKNEQAARDVTTGLGLIGAAAVAGAGLAIKTYANFDKQMSNVKATGGATTAELGKLRDAAIDAGAQTAFSASEAAAGVENLIKAGVSAQDVLGGGLRGSLDLAASGELAVADAAEIAATAMTQFKLGGEDVTHVADLLAAGAGKAMGDVSDLAAALRQGGLVAAQTGLTIEETTGTLSAFASAGLLGSDAGTSLKTMLQRLSAPTKENAELMKSLGISAYDAQGNFVGMESLAGQMTNAFGDMTPAARNAAMATIFGSDAVRAASVVYDEGAKGVHKWIGAVDDQGYAAKTAAARLDNLAGDTEAFGGAVETAFIRAGSGGNDALRGLVQGATDVVNALGRIDGNVLSGLTAAVGAGGVIALGVAGLGKLVIGANNAKTALSTMGISMKTAGALAGGLGAALGIAAIGLTVWATNAAEAQARTEGYIATLDELGNRTETTGDQISTALAKSDVKTWFGDDPQSMIDIGKQLGLTTQDLTDYILGNKDALDKVETAYQANIKGTGGLAGEAEMLKNRLNEESGALSDAEKQAAQKAQADKEAGRAQSDLEANYATTTGAIDEQVASLGDLIEAQQKAAGIVLGARDAQRSYQESLASARKALKDNGATLDVTTAKGRANQETLDGISESALTYVAAMEENGASQKKVQGFIEDSRKSFVKQATAMGMPIEKARELADQLGLIPGNYKADISANTAAAKAGLRDLLTSIESAEGTLTIKGEGAPARKTLDDVTTQVNEADGSVTIRAKDGKAIATLSDYTAKVNESDGTVTIKGEDKQGRKTVLKLTSWVGDQISSIPVDANTSDAQKAVDKFVTLNGGRAIKIGTKILSPDGAYGDGEGAGWPGSTPHGVSAMTKAVQSIDPGSHVTSGYRPGAITSTGYPSYHGMGRAIDIVSSNMGHTWDLLRSAFGSRAKELYYSPRGFIRNGQMTNDVAAVTRAQHYSHVHLALRKGGKVTGPGTGTSDDVPIWASNGEHMWTEAEVRAVGGHDAVHRLRAAALAGEFEGFKTGGAIGSAGGALDAATKRVGNAKDRLQSAKERERAANKAVRDAEKAENKAENVESKAKKDSERKAARAKVKAATAAVRAAEKKVREAEKATAQREKALDQAREDVEEQRSRRGNLGEARRGLSTDLRRGSLMESATSDLSGAYGVVDQMLDLARSGDLTKGQSNRLAKQAGVAERAMRGLYKQAESLDKRLEKAKSRLEDIASIKAAVGSALAGEQNLTDAIKRGQEGAYRDVTRTNSRGETWTEQMWDPGTKDSVTAKGMTKAAQTKAAGLKAFAGKLAKLRKKGMSAVVLQEIAEAGTEEGTLIADAFLKDPGQIDDISKAYRSIKANSNEAGTQVAEAFGLSAAKALVKSLNKQDAAIEKRIRNWGVYMADGLTMALSGKKSGLKKRAAGGPMTAGEPYLTGELGPELIVPSSSGYVLTADQTRRLASSAPTVTASSQTVHTGPLVNVTVEQMVTTDVNAGVNRLTTKMTDAIHTYGLDRLAAGVS